MIAESVIRIDYSDGNWNGDDRVGMAMHMRYADESFFIPDWWQTNYLRHDPRFLIVNKSRRIGWSYITSLKGLLKALDPAVFNYTKQFVSYNMADATEKIAVAREHYLSLPDRYRYKKLVSDQKTQLEFLDTNGRSRSRLISLASKAPRGKGGDISLDEFAFQQKDHDVYIGALPVISRGGNMEIGSTPFGNSGRFHDILTDRTNYPNFHRWNVPWYYSPALTTDMAAAIEAARGGMGQESLVMDYGTEILQEIYRSMPTDDFEQEYACSFRDSSASFITLEMIRACTPTGEAELPQFHDLDELILHFDPTEHGDLFGGYDIGRTNDRSELIVFGYYRDTETVRQIANISLKNVEFDVQEQMLKRFLFELPVARLAIDSTGLGAHIAENVRKASRTGNVEEVVFTAQVKAIMSEAVWLAFDRKTFFLPADRELQQQIHSIKKTVTPGSRTARFDAQRNEDGHADKYWAFALAYYAVSHGYEKKESLKDQWERRKKDPGFRSRQSQADVMRRLNKLNGS